MSHLEVRKTAHQKLYRDDGVNNETVSEIHLRCKSNHVWWKYHVKKFLVMSSYIWEFLVLIIFFSINFDFVCNNSKQVQFAKMPPTMSIEYFVIGNNTFVNGFVKLTTEDAQLTTEVEC